MIVEHQTLDNGAWLPSLDPNFPPFADEHGRQVSEIYILEAHLEVLRDGETDECGWLYAASFPTIFAPRFGGRSRRRLVDRVRRRAWAHTSPQAKTDRLQVKTAEGQVDDCNMGVGISAASGAKSSSSSSSGLHHLPKVGAGAEIGTGDGSLPVYMSNAVPVSAEERTSMGRISFDRSILEAQPSTAIRVVGDVAGACVMAMVAGRAGATPGIQTPSPVARDAAAQHAAAVASACEELVAAAVASAQAVARELSTEVIPEGVTHTKVDTAVEVAAATSPAEADVTERRSVPNNVSREAATIVDSRTTTGVKSATAMPSATKDSNLAALVATQEDVSSATTTTSALGALAHSESATTAELSPHEAAVKPLGLVHGKPRARPCRFRMPELAACSAESQQSRRMSDMHISRSRWHMTDEHQAEMRHHVSPRSTCGSNTSGKGAGRKNDEYGLSDTPFHHACAFLQGLLPWWASCTSQEVTTCSGDCEADEITPVVSAEKVVPNPGVRNHPFSRQGHSMAPPTPASSGVRAVRRAT